VLDVAAADGRNALFLAARGLPVAALDIAPAALARLARAALERGPEVATRLATSTGPRRSRASAHSRASSSSVITRHHRHGIG
jgi:hypothetical protein